MRQETRPVFFFSLIKFSIITDWKCRENLEMSRNFQVKENLELNVREKLFNHPHLFSRLGLTFQTAYFARQLFQIMPFLPSGATFLAMEFDRNIPWQSAKCQGISLPISVATL